MLDLVGMLIDVREELIDMLYRKEDQASLSHPARPLSSGGRAYCVHRQLRLGESLRYSLAKQGFRRIPDQSHGKRNKTASYSIYIYISCDPPWSSTFHNHR